MDNQQDEWRPAILRYRPHRRNNAASFTDRMHLNTYRSSDEANQGKALLTELLGPIQTGKESLAKSSDETPGENHLRRNAGIGGLPALGPADVQGGAGEVDLIPAEIHQFAHPEAVAVGRQDHSGVAVTVRVPLGGIRQAGHFGIGQILVDSQGQDQSEMGRRPYELFPSRRGGNIKLKPPPTSRPVAHEQQKRPSVCARCEALVLLSRIRSWQTLQSDEGPRHR